MINYILPFCTLVWALCIWCLVEAEVARKKAKIRHDEHNN